MRKNKKRIVGLLLAVAMTGVPICGSISVNAAVKSPMASGVTVYSNEKAAVDASNLSEGYVMVKYTGGKPEPIKMIIEKSGGTAYKYNLKGSQYEAFPLTEGNGSYTITVYENVSGNKYVVAFATSVNLQLSNENAPFMYPNQYVNFNANSNVVALAQQIAGGSAKEIDKVTAIYNYVVTNISYDYEKAKTVQSGYLPVIDSVLASKTGICFDYAAVMVAMLRSQGIPSKLIIGYVGDVYHAWISVYIKDVGWVDNIIYFDGTVWKLMDPTFASTSKGADGSITYDPSQKKYDTKLAY